MIILTPDTKYSIELKEDGLPPKDLRDSSQVVKEVWIENVYQLYKEDIGLGTIIDIGANIGAFSIYAASFKDKGYLPKVIAYEPEPHNVIDLSNNIKRNNLTDFITIKTQAVYDFEGKMKITNRGGNSQLNTGEGAEVDVIPLRNVFTDNKIEECDVMKIDIEGAEYAVLLGAEIETLNRIKYLVIEFTGLADTARVGQLMAHLMQCFNIHTIGTPQRGGYIYAKRY